MVPSKLKLIPFYLALAGGLVALPAEAASLGRIHVKSALGQPLNAELEIQSSYSSELEGMTARLAPYAAFQQSEIPLTSQLSKLHFSIEKLPHPVIRITTDTPITEPFLDFLVELSWSGGKQIREYTFLLSPQPPSNAGANPKAVASESPLPVSKDTAPAAIQEPVIPTPTPEAEGARERSVTPTDPPPESSQWLVKRGDTLAAIANKNLPAKVSLDQMLVALYRQNQEAFTGKNMNRLKAGTVLNLPDTATALQSAHPEARSTVLAHANDWNAYRKKLAAMAKQAAGSPHAAEPLSDTTSSGQVTETHLIEPATPTPKDTLKLSGNESSRNGPSEEDLIAREKALSEANTRIADLERNIDELQKLISAKNESIAALQQLAEANKQAQQPPPVAVQPPSPGPQETQEEDPEPPSFSEKVLGILGKPLVWGSMLLALLGTLIFVLAQKLRQRTTPNAEEPPLKPILAPLMHEEEDLDEEEQPIPMETFDPTASFDYSSVNLNLDDEPEAETRDPEPPQPAPEPEPEPEPVDPDAPVEEATTKLLLANAYVEMGDVYGAQQLLREVLEEGNSTQREEATQLLASLGDDIEPPEPAEPPKIVQEEYTAEDFEQLANIFPTGQEPTTGEPEPTPDEEFGLDENTESFEESEFPADENFDEENFPEDAFATGDAVSEPTDADEPLADDETLAIEDALEDFPEEESSPQEELPTESPDAAAEAGWEAIGDLDIPTSQETEETGAESMALDEDDQVATKMELVRAYIDMGDVDGARDLLGEILDEGTDAQKAEAHALMESLANQ